MPRYGRCFIEWQTEQDDIGKGVSLLTPAEKAKIYEMRAEGMSYSQIASSLNISVNTVKSYCRRNNICTKFNDSKKQNDILKNSFCKYCSKPISQTGRHRPRKFCSEDCRRLWWKENEKTASAIYTDAQCRYCGKEFKSRSKEENKYCSHSCYIKDRFGGDTFEHRAV